MKTHRFKVTNTHLFKMKTHRFKVTNTQIKPMATHLFKMKIFLPLEFKVMGVHQIKTMATHQLLMTTSYLRMVNRCPIDAASNYVHNILCNGAIAKIP